MNKRLWMGILMLIPSLLFSQKPVDKLRYQAITPGFYHKILADTSIRTTPSSVAFKRMLAISQKSMPTRIDSYQRIWHQPPLSQGESGTCWCFAAVSFLESECKRLTGKEIKLSEMFFVYHEYLERATQYVKTRGETNFGEGSETSSIPILLKRYGCMPESAYHGKPSTYQFHHHTQMVAEMKSYLENVKNGNAWDEEIVQKTIASILNHYMGQPPASFQYQGKTYDPHAFATEIVGLNPDDYVHFMSNIRQAQNQRGELIENDNWRHFDEYYNISLDEFSNLVHSALEKGYSIAICGDVSEPGFDKTTGTAWVPDFDIPPSHINAFARELRLYNSSTTDDHCMHVVGYTKLNDEEWYLLKDSSSSGFDSPSPGYFYMHEDYVKLKMMNLMLHKEAARQILDHIIK